MLFISPWLGESLAFVTGVVTIFFLVRSKELRQNIWQFLNASFSKKITSLKKLRSYKKEIGSEWFVNLRMDLKSLTDPKARLR